jgi:hypothetical protein
VSAWELAERWEMAREKAGGLVPTDWHSDDDARRCVQWLNHDEYIWLAHDTTRHALTHTTHGQHTRQIG